MKKHGTTIIIVVVVAILAIAGIVWVMQSQNTNNTSNFTTAQLYSMGITQLANGQWQYVGLNTTTTYPNVAAAIKQFNTDNNLN